MRVSINLAAADWKAELFKKCFGSLYHQTVKDFEVALVIVHRDGKIASWVLNEIPDPPFDLKVDVCDCPELHGRATHNNMALDMQEGDVCLMTQDDMIFPVDWIESHIKWHERDDGPWMVSNPMYLQQSDGEYAIADNFWKRRFNPDKTPIVLRWQYMSGHSISVPMETAKKVRLRPDYDGFYGYEDIDFAYRCFLEGCKCAFDSSVRPIHQYHQYAWEKSEEDYEQWIREKQRNKRKFEELNGISPEYGWI
jgi:GT2 family glycosyltransferase